MTKYKLLVPVFFLFFSLVPPSVTASSLGSGQKAFFKNDYQEALTHFSKALTKKPGNAMLHFFMGQCHFKLKQYPDAIYHFEKSLEIKPDYRLARLTLSRACLAMGKTDCALKHYSIIEKKSPRELTEDDILALSHLKKKESAVPEESTPPQSHMAEPVPMVSSATSPPKAPISKISAPDPVPGNIQKKAPAKTEAPGLLPHYTAVLIAVEDYNDPDITDLKHPVSDAMAFKKILVDHYTFKPKNISLLINPTRTQIINIFYQLSRTLGDRDNLLVFYAGHGVWDEMLEVGYWLPGNAQRESRAEWLSNSTIRDFIRGIKSRHTLVIADACFSGGIFKTRNAVSTKNIETKALYKLPSRKAITSGTLSAVPDKSVFVHFLLKRLTRNRFKHISSQILFASLRAAVINNSITEQVPQYGTIFGCGDEGGDFIFTRKQAYP